MDAGFWRAALGVLDSLEQSTLDTLKSFAHF